ncbi:hypothetical protein [Halalkalicoccus salilacus]|uniref:hypothetical protein n=1 Tax=Halalkalicoccus TaxID=332246 RepID=UPI002F96AE7E
MQITITIDEDEVSMSTSGGEEIHESIAVAEPAPARFRGSDVEDETVRDAIPAPARFQPSP